MNGHLARTKADRSFDESTRPSSATIADHIRVEPGLSRCLCIRNERFVTGGTCNVKVEGCGSEAYLACRGPHVLDRNHGGIAVPSLHGLEHGLKRGKPDGRHILPAQKLKSRCLAVSARLALVTNPHRAGGNKKKRDRGKLSLTHMQRKA